MLTHGQKYFKNLVQAARFLKYDWLLFNIVHGRVNAETAQNSYKNFFDILADEYTDISNKVKVSICLRWLDTRKSKYMNILLPSAK